jgi:hypothetical protein
VLTSNSLKGLSEADIQTIRDEVEVSIAENLRIGNSRKDDMSYKPYCCPLCRPVGSWRFRQKKDLLDHLESFHHIIERRSCLGKGGDIKGYACKACRERSHSFDLLRRHLKGAICT